MIKKIDTSGLSCPQPVLLAHEAFKSGDDAYDVLVDNESSLENVSRAAAKRGFTVNPVEQGDGTVLLELRK